MNKCSDNKEETTYRRTKERKSTENQKRVTGYLKNTANQKDNRVNQETVWGSSSHSFPWGNGKLKPPPQSKPSSFHDRLAALAVVHNCITCKP
jgi:hypothetical protein